MFIEPWSDIGEYPEAHISALFRELALELALGHPLFNKPVELLARREDCDHILVSSDSKYFIVHLTWSGKPECPPYPVSEPFNSLEALLAQLQKHAQEY